MQRRVFVVDLHVADLLVDHTSWHGPRHSLFSLHFPTPRQCVVQDNIVNIDLYTFHTTTTLHLPSFHDLVLA